MFTIVGPRTKEAIMSRPEWPEIEKRMKNAYGQDWKLVTHEELLEMNNSKAKPDTPSR